MKKERTQPLRSAWGVLWEIQVLLSLLIALIRVLSFMSLLPVTETCRAGAFCERERASPRCDQGDSPVCMLSSSHWGWVRMKESVTQNHTDYSAACAVQTKCVCYDTGHISVFRSHVFLERYPRH